MANYLCAYIVPKICITPHNIKYTSLTYPLFFTTLKIAFKSFYLILEQDIHSYDIGYDM